VYRFLTPVRVDEVRAELTSEDKFSAVPKLEQSLRVGSARLPPAALRPWKVEGNSWLQGVPSPYAAARQFAIVEPTSHIHPAIVKGAPTLNPDGDLRWSGNG
jgi:hypothetical protein